jgi:uncharacterized membrane protein
MTWLILGLLAFLGLHSLRRLAPRWRSARIAAMGEGAWKGVYGLLSIAAFVLLIWGYGQARNEPLVMLSLPTAGMKHAAALLVTVAFVLLAAAYVPRNHFKARLGHPMTLAVALWAFAHLLANGSLHDVVLFGAYLLWTVLVFGAAYRSEPPTRSGATWVGTLLSVVIGIAAAALFAHFLHARWIGVPLSM